MVEEVHTSSKDKEIGLSWNQVCSRESAEDNEKECYKIVPLAELNDTNVIHYERLIHFSEFLFMTLAGFPAAIQSCGISFVTTLPAPTIERAPICTPFRMMECVPIKTSSSITML